MNGYVGPTTVGAESGPTIKLGNEYYIKTSDFKKLKPVDAVMFLDERWSTIDDGWFWPPKQLWDVENLPAIYHGNSSSISFEDGHAELHHWNDSKFLAATGNGNNMLNVGDAQWMWQHFTGGK